MFYCLVLIIFVLYYFFQAINNLQSTFYGFGFVNSDNVFKVLFLL